MAEESFQMAGANQFNEEFVDGLIILMELPIDGYFPGVKIGLPFANTCGAALKSPIPIYGVGLIQPMQNVHPVGVGLTKTGKGNG